MESEIKKWGILGTGRIAKVFADAIKVADNSELYAVGSRSKENAQNFASQFNVPKYYGSYEELVSDPDVDIIYIATPHTFHLEHTLLALDHDKHVLCEKPLGVNSREVKIMTEKAKEKNLFLMEAMWSRFLPNILKTKELIENNEIGDVKLMTAYFSFRSKNGSEHRHFNPDLCGGTILDIGIYNIFLALYLFGKPLEVSAIAGLSDGGVDTASSYTFKYENDMLAVMYSSFLADSPVVAEIYGSKGKISLEDRWFCPGKVKVSYFDGTEESVETVVKGNGYECEAEEAVKCIADGKLQSDFWSWNNCMELVEMMDLIRNKCGVIYPKHDLI